MASRARSMRRFSSSTARATTLLSRSPAQTRPARSPHQDPIKWQEAKLAARFDDLPAALVHEAMVVVAEQDQVGQVARPTSRPVNDVMPISELHESTDEECNSVRTGARSSPRFRR